MARYIWKHGRFVEKRTGRPLLSKAQRNAPIAMPNVRGDLPEYISPVTGKPVDGRAARREDLARTGCREVDPSEWKPKYRNRKFAEKRGLMKFYEGND